MITLNSKASSLIKSFNRKIHEPFIIIFFIILLAAAFFRFYNIPSRYGFDIDASRDALVSLEGAANLRFPLVGPQSAQGQFNFGPWYYYLLIIATIFYPFGYAPWILMGLLSFLVVIVSFLFGTIVENERLGIILSVLTAFSTSQIKLSTNLSNPDLIPILSWLSLILFFIFLKKSLSKKLLVFWGLSLGIGFFSHFQMIGIFILPFVAIIYKRTKIFQNTLYLFLGLLVSSIPTIIFEIQHKWYSLNGIVYYLQHGSITPNYYPNSWKLYLFNFWPDFFTTTLGVPKSFGIYLLVFMLVVYFVLLIKKRLSTSMLLLIVAFGIIVFAFRYYSGERAIYYLYFLQPFVFIFVGYFIYKLGEVRLGRFWQTILILGFSFFAISGNVEHLGSVDSNRNYTELASEIIKSNKNQSVSIYNCNDAIKNQAYAISYILAIKGKLSNDGTKVGLNDQGCKQNAQNENKLLIYDQYSKVGAVSLSVYETQTRAWSLINPKTVYDTITLSSQESR